MGIAGALAAVGIGGIDSVLPTRYDKETISIVVGMITTPSLLWAQVAWFLLAFGALHVAFALAVFLIPSPFLVRVVRSPDEARRSHYLVALLAVLAVLLLNARIYPHSWFSHSLEPMATGPVGTLALAAVLSGVLVPLALGAIDRVRVLSAGGGRARLLVPVALVLVVAWGTGRALNPEGAGTRPADPEAPHVILVGIDGWRLDTAPGTGGIPGTMPFLDSLMATAAVLQESYTPHARTYPAWMTILSGREPPEHGARFNLVSDDHLDLGATLVDRLRDRGYHALFAMDERRFANIGHHHGFDEVVAPPMGAADFLLARWNDTPLTNLLSPLPFTRHLFPHTYANRGAAATYRPGAFDAMLARSLRNAPERPLFLAVHYELPHWPYHWGERPEHPFEDDPVRGPGYYLETLARADRQVRDLFGVLRREGFLDHAIVVLLSDHGEVFHGLGEVWSSADGHPQVVGRPGHGTDVLSLDQFRVPLAFLRLDGNPLPAAVLPIRGSLADIYPTVAEWLGLPFPEEGSGISLASELLHPSRASWERPITLETGFSLPALLEPDFDERSLLDEGARFYDMTPRGRLVLRDETLGSLMATKQRAVLWGDLLLVARPDLERSSDPRFLKADLRTRTYTLVPGGRIPDSLPEGAIFRWCAAFAAEFPPGAVEGCHER